MITFMMKMDGYTYIEAVEALAKRCGVAIPKETSGKYRKPDEVSRDRVLAMNLDAANFSASSLANQAPMDYLLNRRYSPALIRRFVLGYAPNDFGALTGHMLGLGYNTKELDCVSLRNKQENRQTIRLLSRTDHYTDNRYQKGCYRIRRQSDWTTLCRNTLTRAIRRYLRRAAAFLRLTTPKRAAPKK